MTMISDSLSRERLNPRLPGLDCGLCGCRTCGEFAELLAREPAEIRRCIHLPGASTETGGPENLGAACGGSVHAAPESPACPACDPGDLTDEPTWRDSLDREFDFVLDTFRHEPGPRETIRPHNPLLTRELEVRPGDILIGRPLGMSCGCPITHCGVVMDVDPRTGVIVWCITGPLHPRSREHKDIGFYSAEAYEGLVRESRAELRIGMRYWFMPRRCMLQWRHSGLINFMRRTADGVEVRIEGLLIG